MPKKIGIAIVTVGAVLILSALLLLLYSRCQDAAALLAKVQAATDARRGDLNPELPVVELDGCEYVGCVEIPALEVELPVMADWNYDRLKIAPCRQFGSSRTDDFYSVSKCETLQPTGVDAVQNSGYNLMLYTCTLGGRTRVTVFCDRVE